MRFILYPFSLIYLVISNIRNYLFDLNILKSTSFPYPIICVGNLSLGGTGKTPHVDYLVSILKDKYKIAVISRGYGRKTNKFYYVQKNFNSKLVGDEPLMLKKKYPNIIIAVNNKRKEAINKIKIDFPDVEVFLMDDGFQHRWVKAGLNILITSFDKPFYNDHIFPYGNLRETKKNIKRANIIVVSKIPKDVTVEEQKKVINKINAKKNQEIYFSQIKYTGIKCLNTSNLIKKSLKNYNITLVTGLANSNYIINYLNQNNCSLFKHLKYKDHHEYTQDDCKRILNTYNKDNSIKKVILTTEKDSVKLSKFIAYFENTNFYVLQIKIDFIKEEKIKQKIFDYVKKN